MYSIGRNLDRLTVPKRIIGPNERPPRKCEVKTLVIVEQKNFNTREEKLTDSVRVNRIVL